MPASRVSLLAPAAFRRTPWKNGGGVTVDIADAYRPGVAAPGWDGMLWRFGHTRIERPGPFSDLSGFDRLLAVIEGNGLVLRPQGGSPIDVRLAYRAVRFPGEWAIASELEAGPVGVLNLMADRGRYDIDLIFLRGRDSGNEAAAQCRIFYAVAGDAQVTIDGLRHDVPAGYALRQDDTGVGDTVSATDGIIAIASIGAKPVTPI